MSSLARAAPTARARVAESPESKLRPIAVKDVANRAPAAATLISHARASDIPAPAQLPFTAAMTGLGAAGQRVDDGVIVLVKGGEGGVGVVAQRGGMLGEVLAGAEDLARSDQHHRSHCVVAGDPGHRGQ